MRTRQSIIQQLSQFLALVHGEIDELQKAVSLRLERSITWEEAEEAWLRMRFAAWKQAQWDNAIRDALQPMHPKHNGCGGSLRDLRIGGFTVPQLLPLQDKSPLQEPELMVVTKP